MNLLNETFIVALSWLKLSGKGFDPELACNEVVSIPKMMNNKKLQINKCYTKNQVFLPILALFKRSFDPNLRKSRSLVARLHYTHTYIQTDTNTYM